MTFKNYEKTVFELAFRFRNLEDNREPKQATFWTTDENRKRTFRMVGDGLTQISNWSSILVQKYLIYIHGSVKTS